MEDVPRFRFAPSPTGMPHVGNLHTALFSWALARALRGDFIIRIEDTDDARRAPQAAQQMLDALAWLGIDWDEGPDVGGEAGPYWQSQRLPRHRHVAAQLVAAGHAYYGDDPAQSAAPEGAPLRLRMPREGTTAVHDAIRGPITFDNARLQDPVLVRSNGRPLYHLAAMVDDHDMGITHVVRGEEWIATAPFHVQLYRALGWPEPVWIHLPLILNRRGQKLSKRDPEGGYLISDFQAAGYLPAALFNYLLLLGWTPDGEQEIVDKWTVRQQLRLERLSPSPATFDWDKLRWVNRQYVQRLSDEAVAEGIRPFLEDAYDALPDDKWLLRLAGLLRDGLHTFEDAIDLAGWAFDDGFDMTAAGTAALRTAPAHPVLVQLVAELAAIVLLDEPTAQAILDGLRRRLQAAHGWRTADVYHPIRAALTGDTGGPPLPAVLSLLGKQRALQRLANALTQSA
ncbi:MAG: glutamate--tRNA ligase [Anaerolineales bacterium]|nr:glutamate--tRNA ligase [Anaerolineales bacterium]